MLKIFCLLSIFLSLIYATEFHDLSSMPIVKSADAAAQCEEFPDHLFLPSARGCKFYFYCAEEEQGEAFCPVVDGVQLHFHAESQSCQLPEDADCSLDAGMTGLECPDFGFDKIPHPYMCSKFTVCFDGHQQDRTCPDGLEFSYFEQDCITPAFSNCMSESDRCGVTEFFRQTFFTSTRSCSDYFMCFLHILSHWHCPDGEIFDLSKETCVEDDGSCIPTNPTDNDFPEIPDQSSLDCTVERNEARLPHPDSEHFWFFCHHNESSLIPCYPEQIFDVVTGTCKPSGTD